MKKCVWTALAWTDCIQAHPLERSGRHENQRKKGRISETQLRTYVKHMSQKASKKLNLFWGWRLLGQSRRMLGAPNFFDSKNEVIAPPKVPPWNQTIYKKNVFNCRAIYDNRVNFKPIFIKY